MLKNVFKPSEYNEQVSLFDWASFMSGKYKCLEFMFSTMNGVRLPIGLAVKCKKGGSNKGVPDIILPYPINGFHGLFIELKVGKNKASKEQEKFIKYLKEVGYYATVAYGFNEAKDFIIDYLEGVFERNSEELQKKSKIQKKVS